MQGLAYYAIFSDKTSRILFQNESDQPIKLQKGKLLGTIEPIEPNTPMSYFHKDAHLEIEKNLTEQIYKSPDESEPQLE